MRKTSPRVLLYRLHIWLGLLIQPASQVDLVSSTNHSLPEPIRQYRRLARVSAIQPVLRSRYSFAQCSLYVCLSGAFLFYSAANSKLMSFINHIHLTVIDRSNCQADFFNVDTVLHCFIIITLPSRFCQPFYQKCINIVV